ncbi:MAG: calcium/proton exchanger, partial [Acidobacteriota bacterium]|nr:calcium/proton exchanger [Acidobacteriota bacterium]
MRPSLDWLLVFVPVAIFIHYLHFAGETAVFLVSCIAIIPLAGVLGRATEHLAERTSETVGGLLNATFGNAAELIIGLMAIHRGLYDVAKASITGSIIGNLLLVLGGSMLAGGLRRKAQHFNALAARSQATTLILAAIALTVPAVFHSLAGQSAPASEDQLGLGIACVLLASYGLTLLFTLRTHKHLLTAASVPEGGGKREAVWSLGKSLVVLGAATAFTAWISEILVGAVEPAARALHMSNIFVGVIVVATVGNAAEHSSAILAAWKNRMDLALAISIGSSLQIALLVAPLLVIASRFLGPKPM